MHTEAFFHMYPYCVRGCTSARGHRCVCVCVCVCVCACVLVCLRVRVCVVCVGAGSTRALVRAYMSVNYDAASEGYPTEVDDMDNVKRTRLR